MRRWATVAVVACAGLALAACGDDGGGGGDAAADTAGDAAGADADALDDAGPDAGGDAGDDAGPDGTGDAGDDATGPPPEATLAAGPSTLVVGGAGLLRLERGGQVWLDLPLDGLELGTVPAVDPERAYDPFYLEPEALDEPLAFLYQPLEGLAWVRPAAVTAIEEADEGGLRVTVALEDGRATTLHVTVPADDRVRVHWEAPAGDPPVVFMRLRARASADEGFYGLGETFDHVEHRGRVRAMHFSVAGLESGYNERHVPIPLVVGTRGWGLFVETFRAGAFAVATHADDLVQATFGFGPDADEGLTFHLLAADHPLDVTGRYYDVTGYPGLPAPWALGPLIWRDEVDGQAKVEEDLQTIRDLDLATTGYWIDRPYATDVNSFDFDPARYSDAAAMIAKAHALGLRMALWQAPYLDPDGDASRPYYEEAMAKGYFPPELPTAVAPWGPPLDFSNAEGTAWFQDRLRYYTDLGVQGFKLDYAEEVIVGAFGARIPALFADGTDERTMHRRYAILYHKAHAELLPPGDGFLLCRAGAWGDQVHPIIIWPGDIDANMARFGEEVVEPDGGSYLAVGGLPAAVVAGSGLGPSGFPFFGSDTGGYRHAPPDRETYVRWFQHTALSPAMQVGTNANDLPWSFGKDKVLDEEMLGWYRTYARLHLRLFPYLWTFAERLAVDGRPIQRPLGLAYPELGAHPDFDYLLGDRLLVAPVVTPGATTRTVGLPPGTWVDWWTGEAHEGGQTVTLDAPLETLPLLVQAGAPVPLLRPTIDTLSAVEDPDAVDSWATAAGPLHVRVAAGDAGTFTVHDGTEVGLAPAPLSWRVSRSDGDVYGGPMVFEVFALGAAPEAVLDDAQAPLALVADAAALAEAAAGWTWTDAAGTTAWVKLPAGTASATISFGE